MTWPSSGAPPKPAEAWVTILGEPHDVLEFLTLTEAKAFCMPSRLLRFGACVPEVGADVGIRARVIDLCVF